MKSQIIGSLLTLFQYCQQHCFDYNRLQLVIWSQFTIIPLFYCAFLYFIRWKATDAFQLFVWLIVSHVSQSIDICGGMQQMMWTTHQQLITSIGLHLLCHQKNAAGFIGEWLLNNDDGWAQLVAGFSGNRCKRQMQMLYGVVRSGTK